MKLKTRFKKYMQKKQIGIQSSGKLCTFIVLFLIQSFDVTKGIAQTNQQVKLTDPIPVEDGVIVGKLDNGLTYYVVENHEPKNRAELRLVINAGSIVENENQQGIAHFLEHMAFNGTKRFEKNQIIDFMESVGMQFGAHLNAYTSFDETVYKLKVPTDTTGILEKGFDILEDWLYDMTLDETETIKERGVVIEEWRLSRGAGQRIWMDKHFPVVFKGSKYPIRFPIGKKEILEKIMPALLKQYYKKWYRPAFAAVVAVGDFDQNEIIEMIKKRFSRTHMNRGTLPKRIASKVEDHKDIYFNAATDSEERFVLTTFAYAKNPEHVRFIGDLKKVMLENLYEQMVAQRFDELVQNPEAPVIQIQSGLGMLSVRTKDVYSILGVMKPNKVKEGITLLATEAARLKQHSFTETELERAKKELLRRFEVRYNERTNRTSHHRATRLQKNYLDKVSIVGPKDSYEIAKQLIPTITIADLWSTIHSNIREDNLTILLQGNSKDSLSLPSKDETIALYKKAMGKKVNPYKDDIPVGSLFEKQLTPGKITTTKSIDAFGATEWILSNGIRVIWKKTDFKNDEIIVSASSEGGTSLVDDKDWRTASMASTIVQYAGVSTFKSTQLTKLLDGKNVYLDAQIDEQSEGFFGSASPKDVETLFQLIYLRATEPRIDEADFASLMMRMTASLENKYKNPQAVFRDTLSQVLSQYHPRRKPLTLETLKQINYQKAVAIYKDRFSDFSDFVFTIVGNINEKKLNLFCEKYLASLPSINRKETWRDEGIQLPKGIIVKNVKVGVDEKSTVSINFLGDTIWSGKNNVLLNATLYALKTRLREILREDKGGVYGVGVYGGISKYPKQRYSVSITFGCSPDRVDELVREIFKEIDRMKKKGVDESYINRYMEIQKRAREENLRKNNFWTSIIEHSVNLHISPKEAMKFEEYLKAVSNKSIKKDMNQYFDMNNYVKVTLYPKDYEK